MMNAKEHETAKDDTSASVPAAVPASASASDGLIAVPGAFPEEDSLASPEPAAAESADQLVAVLPASNDGPALSEIESDADVEAAVGSGFRPFGLCAELMRGIEEAGFRSPTPIQAKAIPELLAGRDLIGQALTGTGKTAAFGLPAMEKLRGTSGLRLLVLVPTRELAAQVSGELFKLGRYTGLHTAAFTGGQSYTRQEQMLSKGINALVATPGRLIDLIESGHFKNVNPSFIVVDEADEMLDMGFLDDVRRIFSEFPGPHQTMLFSATMPRPVVALAQSILRNPVEITTATNESTNNDIEQLFYVIEDSERTNAVIRLIDAEDVGKAIIFCRTREETDSLNILLGGRGYNVNCLHGDMEQAQRSRVMAAFRRGEIDILVATDVAARGLDVDDVTHVFNFHMPFDSRGYVHRIGRTGRAGKTGTAITLVTPREMRQLESIKRTVGAQMEHRLIPTRSEVTSQRLKRIFQALHDYELDIDLLNQIQTLSENQDVLILMAKLLKHQLSGGADQGPERIGVDGQRLSRLLDPRPRDSRESRGGRDSRGGRPMSRRGGGSEGQRYRHEDNRAPFVRGPVRPVDASPSPVVSAAPIADAKPAVVREAVFAKPMATSPSPVAPAAVPLQRERPAAETSAPARVERPERTERAPERREGFGAGREDRPYRGAAAPGGDRPYRGRDERGGYAGGGAAPGGDRPYRGRDERGGYAGGGAAPVGDRPYRGRDERGGYAGGGSAPGGDRPYRGGDRPFRAGPGSSAPQGPRGETDARTGHSGEKPKPKKFNPTGSSPKPAGGGGGQGWYLS